MFADKPFIKIILPFITGILFAIYFPELISLNHCFAACIVFVLFLIVDHFYFKTHKIYKYRYVIAGIIHTGIIFFGMLLTLFNAQILNATDEKLFKHKDGLAIAEIIETPEIKEKSVKIIIKLKALKKNESELKFNGKAILYLEKDSLSLLLKNGDEILFTPNFKEIDAPKNPAEFNYKQYLSYHHIKYQSYLNSGKWIRTKSNHNLKRYASDIRNYLLEKLKNVLPEKSSFAVASALLLGYKDELDAPIQNAYSGSGAMHVLAVSGLHAGFIYMILNTVLFFLERNKKTRFIKTCIIIIGLWCYAFITGLSPSVLRAATMFSFVVIGKTINRQTNIYNTLAASGFILLCFNPYLIMEVGFQLSYLAVIGIVFFQKKIYNLYYIKNYPADKIWAITSVSLAAQLTTFPLGLLYFHQFPNYFLFSNLIVIPLAILILGIGILFFIFSSVSFLYTLFGQIISWLVYILNCSVMFIEKLPYAIIKGIDISVAECWLIFLIILLSAAFIEYKKYIYIFSSLLFCLVLCIYNLAEKVEQYNQKKVFIYHINKLTAINFIDGSDNILIADKELINNPDKMMFHIYHNWYRSGINTVKFINVNYLDKKRELHNMYRINNDKLFIKENYLQFYNHTFVIINNRKQLFDSLKYRLPVDYVIITKDPDITLNDINRNFEYKAIIADASNSNFKINNWLNELAEVNNKFYNIKDKGAWVLDLNISIY